MEFQLIQYVRARQAGIAQSPKICLFLGAGADIGAGGLTFQQLKKNWYIDILRRGVHFEHSEDEIDAHFQQHLQKVPHEERGLLIQAMFKKSATGDPSDAYKILALLIKSGGIDAVLTTNFDTMLERASDLLGGRSFDVYAPGIAKPFRTEKGNFPYIGCPYIKLHGDLRSGVVTVLTQEEIDNEKYDVDIIDLTNQILASHMLVIAGYSGWDKALAEIIGKSVKENKHKVFWCNPSPPHIDSYLWKNLPEDRISYIKANFLEAIAMLARSRFERPFEIQSTTPTFIKPLFHWRLEHAKHEFIKEYASHKGIDCTRLLVRRAHAEKSLHSFITSHSEKNLAVVVGPSGMGKTTLGVRLAINQPSNTCVLLIKGKNYAHDIGLERMVLSYAGITSPDTINLLSFANWLSNEGLRLIIYLDALNESSSLERECLQSMKNIARTCYALHGHNALRFVVTMRHELWECLLRDLDKYLLSQVLWNEGNKSDVIVPISLDRFTDNELSLALNNYIDGKILPPDYASLLAKEREYLRDPYLFGMITQESGGGGVQYINSSDLMNILYMNKLKSVATNCSAGVLFQVLIKLAAQAFLSGTSSLRETDVLQLLPTDIAHVVLNALVENRFLAKGTQGMYHFAHDTIFHFFLAKAMRGGYGLPYLETFEDLSLFIKEFSDNNQVMSAAYLLFIEELASYIRLIDQAQQLLNSFYPSILNEQIFIFSKKILLTAANEYFYRNFSYKEGDERSKRFDENLRALLSYCEHVIRHCTEKESSSLQLKTVIQMASMLEIKKAVSLIAIALDANDYQSVVEAQIYIVDCLSHELLTNSSIDNILSCDSFAAYLGENLVIPPWEKICRLLLLVSSLGRDNTHEKEYTRIQPLFLDAFMQLVNGMYVTKQDLTAIINSIYRNLDRYLFNAKEEEFRQFFSNQGRNCFIHIIDKLSNKACLDKDDLIAIQPYTRSLQYPLEFNFLNIIFCISAHNNFNNTLSVWEEWTNAFDDASHPEEVDFYVGVLKFIFITTNQFELHKMEILITRILKSMPSVLQYLPGLWRGERRGFSNHFDMIFEDGFNPISAYFNLKASTIRQTMTLNEFEKTDIMRQKDLRTVAPFYADALEGYLAHQEIHKALVVIQGFGNTIASIPEIGLSFLRELAGSRIPMVRQAVVRLLKEAYARHPAQTRKFLELVRGSFDEEELRSIQAALDPRLGCRKLSGAEWARILRFILFEVPGGQESILKSMHIFCTSNSMNEAALAIIELLGIYAS